MPIPTVTAIIPTYNSADVLPRALASIATQTHPVDEIIVVDDGSADETQALFAEQQEIRYVRQSNQGASAARNHGARIATGEWLAFLDADDEWEPSKIERQLELVDRRNAIACMTSAYVWAPAANQWIEIRYFGERDRRHMQRQLLIRNILTGICSSLLIKRDLFERIDGFAHGKGSEDRRIAIDILRHTDIQIVDEPLIRQQPGPAHFGNPEIHRRMMLELCSDYAPLYRKIDASGLLRLRAHARIHERSGMHYLENGDLPAALYDMIFSAALWPWQPNPWRVFINSALGRAVRKNPIAPAVVV